MEPIRRFTCECIPEHLEEAAATAIPLANPCFFSCNDEKVEVLQTGALSQLMYDKDFRPLLEVLGEVNGLFFHPYGQNLKALPTLRDYVISLPAGCSVQAFLETTTGKVYLCFRGTQLDLDKDTKIENLIVDLGIGDLKTPDDLNSSIQAVCAHISDFHNVDLASPARILAMKTGEALVQRKVTGTTAEERHSSVAHGYLSDLIDSCCWAYDTAASAASSAVEFALERPVAATGIGAATLAAGAVAGSAALIATGLSTAKVGVGVALVAQAGKTAVRATVAGITTLGGYLGVGKSSYTVLTEYVEGCDSYVMALKAAGLIRDDTPVIATGHSLGGYLSAVIGAMHAHRIVAHNGPGAIFTNDVVQICKSLNLERTVRKDVTYSSYSQCGDFIGNLFKRDGSLKGIRFAHATYPSPLSHHKMRIMNLLYGILPVAQTHVPLPVRALTLQGDAEPSSGEALAATESPRFGIETYYRPSGLLMLEDQKSSET